MRITMIGIGYVGLVSGVCLAEMGNEVICVDNDEKKINALNNGIMPIYEPGIESLIKNNQKLKRLFFVSDLALAIKNAEIVFIAVGTPSQENGEVDTKYVMEVVSDIAQSIDHHVHLVVKSTVPVGTCDKIEAILAHKLRERNQDYNLTIISNPEFLKTGSALSDFMNPDRIVIGVKCEDDSSLIKKLYVPFVRNETNKLQIVSRRSSELIKYTSNAMLAVRISFMNEISRLCEYLDANVDEVREGIGADPRIGKEFLLAGPGYGGSCFPKDVAALIEMGNGSNCPMNILKAVQEVNESQKIFAFEKIKSHFGVLKNTSIAIWGLAFKPGTDDVREAPAKIIIHNLLETDATVTAHDPKAMNRFHVEFGPRERLSYAQNAYAAVREADALVLLSEWDEYRLADWEKIGNLMRQKVIFDFRNQYTPMKIKNLGFNYYSIGRPHV